MIQITGFMVGALQRSNTSKLQGIVIRAYPSGESDMVLRLLTPTHGKVSVYARGVRRSKKRFGSNIEVFDRGEFSVVSRRGTLLDLDGFSSSSVCRSIREDFDRLAAASLLCESFDLLIKEIEIEESESTELFQLFELSLSAIDEADTSSLICRAVFYGLANLLAISGFHDRARALAPSSHNLLTVIMAVEEHGERELSSKQAFLTVLKQLILEKSS